MSSLQSRVLHAIRDCVGGATRRQIGFYANIHGSSLHDTIADLLRDGRIVRAVRPIRWHGRGNGTLFTVIEDRMVYCVGSPSDTQKTSP